MIENLETKAIISPQEISILIKDHRKSRVVFLDSSFYLPNSSKDAAELYKQCHIKDSRFFDIKNIKNHQSALPHMLPTKELFEKEMSKIGIKNSDIIITYGQNGMIMGPCRAWWMIKGFGHKKVMVLDGGMENWKRSGLPVTDMQTEIVPSHYKASNFNQKYIVNMHDVIEASNKQTRPIIDARPADRFSGESAEPREGMRSGHIPNSINLPCSQLVDENGCMKPLSALEKLFKEAGIELKTDSDYITTCGSGVTACALSLALNLLGVENVAVYDGSWSQWGLSDSPTIVAK